jgi:hypothetical protein
MSHGLSTDWLGAMRVTCTHHFIETLLSPGGGSVLRVKLLVNRATIKTEVQIRGGSAHPLGDSY